MSCNDYFCKMIITLYGLPKISLNKWYAGTHWTKRKKMKDQYVTFIQSQFNKVLPKVNAYSVKYDFTFKSRPLDASNCVAMVKMIEDVIFENDGYNVIKNISISSSKGKEDFVIISIEPL